MAPPFLPHSRGFSSVVLHQKEVRDTIFEKWKGKGRGFGLTIWVLGRGCNDLGKLHLLFPASPSAFQHQYRFGVFITEMKKKNSTSSLGEDSGATLTVVGLSSGHPSSSSSPVD